jgi:CYTH domain-containing protein
MPAHSTHEIELKRRLVGLDAADRLIEVLGPVASDVEQVNHVFDTPDRSLHRARHSLRLREEAGRFILTAKGPSRGVSGSVSTRTEAESEIEPDVARRLLAAQGDPLTELRRRVTEADFDALWAGLEKARAGQPLGELGQFHNRRRTVQVAVSPGLRLSVEVDRTRFPNGRVDDEVEIELASAERAGEVEAWLEERAAVAGVETQPSTAKFGRFYAALEERAP